MLKVQWFRYLILLGTWLAFAAVAAACYQFSSDNGPEDDPLEPGEGKGGGGGGGGQEWSDATLAVSTPPSATVEADVEEVEELNGSFIDRVSFDKIYRKIIIPWISAFLVFRESKQ